MGKSISLIGHSALIVSLTREHKPKISQCPQKISSTRQKLHSVRLPHGVEHGPILHDAEEFVRRGHVVRDRLL